MMPFLLAEFANLDRPLPLYVLCVGSHEQKELDRGPAGYPAHQLFLSRSGKGTFYTEDGRKLTLTRGMVLLLPAHVGHRYTPDDSGEVWDLGFVAFHGEVAAALILQMDEFILKPMQAPNFSSLWKQLEALWQWISLNGEQGYWEASRRMYDILLTFLEGQSPIKKSPKKVYPANQPNPALQAAVQLIHDHYDERLLLANVARAAGYSIQHFHRLFVAHFSVTPQQYILQLRMRRALQLFDDHPGITVARVAERLGMDTSYFIRMFKRTYGITPKKYVTA